MRKKRPARNILPRNCIILWKTLLLHNLTDSDIMVKILWVDDEIELLKPHVLFLRQKGYEVDTCNNGYDAIDMATEGGYDLIILDEMMPGMTGLETSELLVSQGNHVTIVEMAPRIAPGAYFQHVDDAMPKLQAAHTVFMVGQKLLAVHQDNIELENVDTGSKTMVPCDLVVLSLGVRPENGLYESIKSSFSRVYNIGDSNKIGRIHNATEAAYQLAMSL